MEKQTPPAYAPIMQQPSEFENSAVVMVQNPAFGPVPIEMVCPHCHANIRTRMEKKATSKTHLFALLLCVFGCCCCAPCPYYMDSCLAKYHYCPACSAYLGVFNPN